MTRRVTLRLLPGYASPEREKIFGNLYSEIGVALTRLIDSRTGFVALCYSEKDVDTILSGGSTRSLKEIGLEPRMPPEIVAQRSVICRRIDPYVGTHTALEIKNEIKTRQEWSDVSEVIKFGNNTHVFKIIFYGY